MIRITSGITLAHLNQVYSDPRISIVGHDHRPAQPISHPSAIYLSVHVDDVFCGAFLLIQVSTVEMDIHALLLKCATLESRNIGRAVLTYIFGTWANILRITGYVISKNQLASNYCRRVGMTFEGTRRHAVVQNGVILDVNIMGITRQDHDNDRT